MTRQEESLPNPSPCCGRSVHCYALPRADPDMIDTPSGFCLG